MGNVKIKNIYCLLFVFIFLSPVLAEEGFYNIHDSLIPAKVRELVPAVVLIRIAEGAPWGDTGFFIGKNNLITTYHLLRDGYKISRKELSEKNYTINVSDRNLKIKLTHFSLRKNRFIAYETRLNLVKCHESQDLCYLLVENAMEPEIYINPEKISLLQETEENNNFAHYLIGFPSLPDKEGNAESRENNCYYLKLLFCQKEKISRGSQIRTGQEIELYNSAGAETQVLKDIYLSDIDSSFGASGSPIVDNKGNLIGILIGSKNTLEKYTGVISSVFISSVVIKNFYQHI